MSGRDISRRTTLKVIAAAPFVGAVMPFEPEILAVRQRVEAVLASGATYEPHFFTPAEWQTVRLLADLIIPRDARSGSASDAGAPEFIDFMMIDQPARQEPMRSGLVWLDAESSRRFAKRFVDCEAAQQAALLDDIAWPARAPDTLKDGVAFFVNFRNLALTGFWSSQIGIRDLQYQGNTFVPHWEGCPPAALEKLGVSYND